ncbi:zinc finger protein 233-like [Anneissia japonica]|uniref:zinc finger protein 233-like n=1 Tax=Anneissia japonica TaxID=1529436 RepID=UPI001425B24D|nr:zinc finger protein 233-like [Anneissia japonica]
MASCYYSPYQTTSEPASDLWKSPSTTEFGLGLKGRGELDYNVHFPCSSYQQTYTDFYHYTDLQSECPSTTLFYSDGAIGDTNRSLRSNSHHRYYQLNSETYSKPTHSASQTTFPHYLNHHVWRSPDTGKQPSLLEPSQSSYSSYQCAEKNNNCYRSCQIDNDFYRPVECSKVAAVYISNSLDYNPVGYCRLRDEGFSTSSNQSNAGTTSNSCDLQIKSDVTTGNTLTDEAFENEHFSMKSVKTENKKSGNNVCRLCKKSYARPSTLKTHMRVHSGEKPYKCSRCKKSFSQTANLTAHMRVHSGDRPFSCFVCHRKFSQSSSVTTHMRIHSGERPYRCSFCRKAFADSSTLTKHLRVHSGEKPYRCNTCHLRFSQSGNLTRHMRVHGQN